MRFSRAIWRPKEITISRISRPPTPAIQPSSMEKSLPPVASAAKIARPSVIVVAHTTDSRPAMTAITCPAVPSRNGLNTTSSAIIASDPMMVNGTTAGLAESPYAMPGTSASATNTTYATIWIANTLPKTTFDGFCWETACGAVISDPLFILWSIRMQYE